MAEAAAQNRSNGRRPNRRREMLDATIACLIERGYAGTSTTEIAKRAGVTGGALFRHWATKGELLAAAAAVLFERITAKYEAAFRAADSALPPLELAFNLLWEFLQEPEHQARTELLVAARTDADLAVALTRLERAHEGRVVEVARHLLPEIAAKRTDFNGLVHLVISAVVGASMGATAFPELAESRRNAHVRALTAAATAVLRDPRPPDATTKDPS